MFLSVVSQFDRHGNLWFGVEDDFVSRFTSRVINTGIVLERKLWRERSPVSASIVQRNSPIASNLLVLSLYFAVCLRRVSCTWSKGNSQLFSPLDENCVEKGCHSIVYDRLRNSKLKYPFSDCGTGSLCSGISNKIDHWETRERVN